MHHRLPTGQPDNVIFSTAVSYSQMTLTCVKLTKKQKTNQPSNGGDSSDGNGGDVENDCGGEDDGDGNGDDNVEG